ncbi:MAG: threonylcarbamoyl-AMP synthase [Bacteroidales bacterium]|nr:threonylcarbamoyl-AMP synthase [Bacteroidales bacterium]
MIRKFEEDIENALRILRGGGVILYPTDTVWGLGCDATNGDAVKKIFKIKSRQEEKSLIILVNGEEMLGRYVKDVPEIVYEIIHINDKPLTVVYPRGRNLADDVCSKDGSVAVRICNDEFCNELITRFRKPIVSTSANISGKPTPSNFSEIGEDIRNAVDYIVKFRQDETERNTSSPVIRFFPDGTFKILRK